MSRSRDLAASDEWLGAPRAATFPLALVANNPASRLHSQLDIGAYSQASKVNGREPVRMHPDDAAARGIPSGDVVRLFNDRGSCLAGAVLTTDVRRGVVQLSTGAWFDPDDPRAEIAMCVHGNPNMLTRDIGTSRLSQGCSGQHALVEVERFAGVAPPVQSVRAADDLSTKRCLNSPRCPRPVPVRTWSFSEPRPDGAMRR